MLPSRMLQDYIQKKIESISYSVLSDSLLPNGL